MVSWFPIPDHDCISGERVEGCFERDFHHPVTALRDRHWHLLYARSPRIANNGSLERGLLYGFVRTQSHGELRLP